MDPPPSPSRLARAAPWAAALLGAALYLNTLSHGFVFDDIHVVQENPSIRGLDRLPALFARGYWDHEESWDRLYRPVTMATYALNHAWTGLGPWSYHLVNALLHGVVVLLLHALARRLMPPAGAFLAALLFAAHPVHTEAVANVVGRAELLAAAFGLGALLVHARGGRPLWVGVLTLLAALSKEGAVALPAILVLWESIRPSAGRRRWASPLASAAAVAATLVLRRLVLGVLVAAPDPDPELGLLHHEDLRTRLLTALHVLSRYLLLLVKPWPLSADHSFNQIPLVREPADPGVLAGAAGLLLLCALALLLRRRAAPIAFGAGLIVLPLLPVSNLLVPIGTIMAERLLFIPSAGLCLAAGSMLRRAGRTGFALGLAAAAAGGALTWVRNADWSDQFTLFSATAQTSPRSVRIQMHLGRWLLERGRVDEAAACEERVLAESPENHGAHFVLGNIAFGRGDHASAARHFEAAGRSRPRHALSRHNLGQSLRALGDAAGAEAAYREALRLRPDLPPARYELGTLLCETGRLEEGLREIRAAVALEPGKALWRRGLAVALEQAGDFEGAERERRLAEALESGGPGRPGEPPR